MHKTSDNKTFMRYALSLAQRGLGTTFPNPSVGCVIVRDGQVIATGHTAPEGRPHAETIALAKAGDDAKNSVMYVTLEPCCHHGKTAPCVDSIIHSGIKKVFIAVQDPFEKVSGGGIAALRNAGIEVIIGLCEDEAREINKAFFCIQEKKRPYITLKIASSADGKIASSTGKSKWITNQHSRNFGHLLRARNDAIMVGINTVLADNPNLDCRLPGLTYKSPVRIIADSNNRLPEESNLVKTASEIPLWHLTCGEYDRKNIKNINCAKLENSIDLKDTLTKIAAEGITSILVEGGATLATSLLKNKLVDEIMWFKAPIIIGNDGTAALHSLSVDDLQNAVQLKLSGRKEFAGDVLERYRL